jgi:hypothetical protein
MNYMFVTKSSTSCENLAILIRMDEIACSKTQAGNFNHEAGALKTYIHLRRVEILAPAINTGRHGIDCGRIFHSHSPPLSRYVTAYKLY